LFFAYTRCKGLSWRISFLVTSVIWGCAVTILTEFLSLFTALNRPSLAAGWVILAITAGMLLFRTGLILKPPEVPTLSRTDKFLVIVIVGILTCTFVIAVVSPPNNNDSLTYHMSRVMHWLQQGSVAHFPTNVLRQLEMNPWAEFAILHLQLLSGSDYLANLVQWFSMAACIVGVSLIAGMFEVSMRGQLLSALIAATVPMAILQSSNTQNDLVVSFWLVCFVFFGLMSIRERSLKWSMLMSISLGLAILTKGTAYIFAFPFVLWFFVQDLSRSSWQHTWLKYLVLAGIVLSLNFGHFHRNYKLFDNPLHSGNDPYSNSFVSPGVVLSNISRNVALHLLTPSLTLNKYLVSVLDSLHKVLGVGIDDPATTWPGTSINERRLAPHEDSSGNPLHFCLFLTVASMLMYKKRLHEIRLYSLMVFTGFLLFCILLRWQPWHSRLHLPLFVLFSPVAGIIISGLKLERIDRGLILLLSIAALPWVFCNATRPIISLSAFIPEYPASIFAVPRRLQYFGNNSCDQKSYIDAAFFIVQRGAKNVGLKTGENAREYPLWVLTRKNGLEGPRIEHVDVQNISNSIPRTQFKPDVVVVLTSKNKSCAASVN
jgi:hypothetical protein